MTSEVEIAIKEYYDINEKIKLLEKRKSELKEVLNSVFDSKKTNELKAENIIIYRVNRPRISWDGSVIKSILAPKGLWESVIGFDNKKVRNLIENHVISDKEIEKAKITVDTWYTYTEQVPIEHQSLSENNIRGEYTVYCLLCDRNARYIGMTKELSKTFQLHKSGEMGYFTKTYKPKKVEFNDYFENEIDAKIKQIEILDKLRVKYGRYIKIYTEFIDSKSDERIVWEDIIPPADVELFENTPIGPNIKFWVYVLKLEESNYYVGYTSNLRKRFKDHASGSGGSNQTYYYAPISVLHIEGYENAKSAQVAEKNWTLDLKKLKGKNNVKGYWAKTGDADVPAYFAHELLDNWEIKNSKAYEI